MEFNVGTEGEEKRFGQRRHFRGVRHVDNEDRRAESAKGGEIPGLRFEGVEDLLQLGAGGAVFDRGVEFLVRDLAIIRKRIMVSCLDGWVERR
jgi:hypothetical protein